MGSGVEKDSLITIQGEHRCQLFSINKSPQLLGKSVIIECAVVSWTSAASAQIFWACCQWRVSPLLTQPLATPRRWVARRQEWGQLRSTRRPRSSSTAPSVPGGCTVVVLFWIRRSNQLIVDYMESLLWSRALIITASHERGVRLKQAKSKT